jgi:hypothetical protein
MHDKNLLASAGPIGGVKPKDSEDNKGGAQ